MTAPEHTREDYASRIRWMMTGRVLLLSFLLAILIVFQHRYRIYPFPVSYLYYILLGIFALTGAYYYLVDRLRNLQFLVYLQVSVDILLITFLVHLTGGIDSGLSILYHMSILSASILLYRRGGYLSASLSSILYGAMLDLQYYNVPGFVRSGNFTAMQVFSQVFVNIFSFYIVAFLSGYLAERLRSTRQAL